MLTFGLLLTETYFWCLAQKKYTVGDTNRNTSSNSSYIVSKSKIFYTLVVLCLCIFVVSKIGAKKDQSAALLYADKEKIGSFPIVEPTQKFGFVLDTFNVYESNIKENEFLSDILLKHKVDYVNIDKIAKETRDIFDVRSLRANKPYTILNKDTSTSADYFIFEPNSYHYVVYDLIHPSKSKIVKRRIDKVIKEASGIVDGSLWSTMKANGLNQELTSKMEDALAWSVDFYHIQKGDKFKAYYEQDYIDGELVGIGKLFGAYYKNSDQEYYAIYFENEKHHGFFDLTGRPMKKAFLKAPVKYSRISSRFSKRRFHPVLRRFKSHLGTDYAAPRGTPIMAVADGVVSKRAYTKNNGYYVKLKHDKMYSTQYLHMSKFKKDVKAGSYVKQGDVIGYVGKTGLATGNHVCYRFWKNGVQVDPRSQNLPPPDPMPEQYLPAFYEVKDSIKTIIDRIEYKAFPADEARMETKSLAPLALDSTLNL